MTWGHDANKNKGAADICVILSLMIVIIGSPAEAAGLMKGDRIVEVNGQNVFNENHRQVSDIH